MKATGKRPKIIVSGDGRSVVGHAGARLLTDVADAAGLTGAFSEVLSGLRQRRGGHDPGRVAVDLAVTIADGGEAIGDLAVLRDQSGLFGAVASDATAWRVLSALDSEAASLRVARAPEPIKINEAGIGHIVCVTAGGWLIQAVPGMGGVTGRRRNRWGLAV